VWEQQSTQMLATWSIAAQQQQEEEQVKDQETQKKRQQQNRQRQLRQRQRQQRPARPVTPMTDSALRQRLARPEVWLKKTTNRYTIGEGVPLVVELSQQVDRLLGKIQSRNQRIERARKLQQDQQCRLQSFGGSDKLEEELRQLRHHEEKESSSAAREEAGLAKQVKELELKNGKLRSSVDGHTSGNEEMRQTLNRERATTFRMLGELQERKDALEKTLLEQQGTTVMQLQGRRETQMGHARAEAEKSAGIRRKLLDANREAEELMRQQRKACSCATSLRLSNTKLNRWLPIQDIGGYFGAGSGSGAAGAAGAAGADAGTKKRKAKARHVLSGLTIHLTEEDVRGVVSEEERYYGRDEEEERELEQVIEKDDLQQVQTDSHIAAGARLTAAQAQRRSTRRPTKRLTNNSGVTFVKTGGARRQTGMALADLAMAPGLATPVPVQGGSNSPWHQELRLIRQVLVQLSTALTVVFEHYAGASPKPAEEGLLLAAVVKQTARSGDSITAKLSPEQWGEFLSDCNITSPNFPPGAVRVVMNRAGIDGDISFGQFRELLVRIAIRKHHELTHEADRVAAFIEEVLLQMQERT
jgi:hypothetical protein